MKVNVNEVLKLWILTVDYFSNDNIISITHIQFKYTTTIENFMKKNNKHSHFLQRNKYSYITYNESYRNSWSKNQ